MTAFLVFACLLDATVALVLTLFLTDALRRERTADELRRARRQRVFDRPLPLRAATPVERRRIRAAHVPERRAA